MCECVVVLFCVAVCHIALSGVGVVLRCVGMFYGCVVLCLVVVCVVCVDVVCCFELCCVFVVC